MELKGHQLMDKKISQFWRKVGFGPEDRIRNAPQESNYVLKRRVGNTVDMKFKMPRNQIRGSLSLVETSKQNKLTIKFFVRTDDFVLKVDR